MADVSNRNRKPAGAPTGGEFDVERREEARGRLLSLRDRASLLASGAYAPPAVTVPLMSPESSGDREQWWTDEFATAEYGHAEGSYAQMPDDYTPSRTLGQALSGHRRTHRMNYAGSGVSIRMPSATSIKRFAVENNRNTFDVPISADTPIGPVAGWVRVTPGANGAFEVVGLGMPSGQEAYVAEAARAVLEGRRPTMALTQVGNLLARRRERAERIGTEIHPVRSTWIEGLGYDDTQNMMVMTTGGRQYGYHIDRATYEKVAKSGAPGREYNSLVKNHAERMSVQRCKGCGRFYNEDKGHSCQVSVKPRSTEVFAQNEAAAARVQALGRATPATETSKPASPVAVLVPRMPVAPVPGRSTPFGSAGAPEAIELQKLLSPAALERCAAPGSPSAKAILWAVQHYPRELAFAGVVRNDDVAVTGVYLFGQGDLAPGYVYQRFAKGFPKAGRPSELTKVHVPGRGIAWLATWGR